MLSLAVYCLPQADLAHAERWIVGWDFFNWQGQISVQLCNESIESQSWPIYSIDLAQILSVLTASTTQRVTNPSDWSLIFFSSLFATSKGLCRSLHNLCSEQKGLTDVAYIPGLGQLASSHKIHYLLSDVLIFVSFRNPDRRNLLQLYCTKAGCKQVTWHGNQTPFINQHF